jgi:hypothetical protein
LHPEVLSYVEWTARRLDYSGHDDSTGGYMFPSIFGKQTDISHRQIAVLTRRASSCELFGIDAYAEDDLGYAPS